MLSFGTFNVMTDLEEATFFHSHSDYWWMRNAYDSKRLYNMADVFMRATTK